MFQNQVGLPWYISSSMYFTVNILLVTQTYCSCGFFIIGFLLLVRTIYIIVKRKQLSSVNLYLYSSLDPIPSAEKCWRLQLLVPASGCKCGFTGAQIPTTAPTICDNNIPYTRLVQTLYCDQITLQCCNIVKLVVFLYCSFVNKLTSWHLYLI